jgi:hypothetical protein
VRRASSSRPGNDCPAVQHLSNLELTDLIDRTPLSRRDSTIAFERLVNRLCLSDIAAIVGGDRSNIGWRLKRVIYPALCAQYLRSDIPHLQSVL